MIVATFKAIQDKLLLERSWRLPCGTNQSQARSKEGE